MEAREKKRVRGRERETLREGGSGSLTKMNEQLRKYPIQNECLTLNEFSFIHSQNKTGSGTTPTTTKYE